MCEKSETIIKSDYFCTFSLHYKSLITKKKQASQISPSQREEFKHNNPLIIKQKAVFKPPLSRVKCPPKVGQKTK